MCFSLQVPCVGTHLDRENPANFQVWRRGLWGVGWGMSFQHMRSIRSHRCGEEHMSPLGKESRQRLGFLKPDMVGSFPCCIGKVHEEACIGSVQRSQTLLFPLSRRQSVNVLGEPAEALTVALPLQHTAHEHFHGASIQLLQGHISLKEAKTAKTR